MERASAKVFPGIPALFGDGCRVKQEMLEEMIAPNRKDGFRGECAFFFEGLKMLKPYYL